MSTFDAWLNTLPATVAENIRGADSRGESYTRKAWDAAIEAAALLCVQQQTRHGSRLGGSDGPDAARRACAVRILELK